MLHAKCIQGAVADRLAVGRVAASSSLEFGAWRATSLGWISGVRSLRLTPWHCVRWVRYT